MAKKALPVIDVPKAGAETIKDKAATVAVTSALSTEVSNIGEIRTDEDLRVADSLFGRIQQARKTWKLKMYGTAAKPGIIPSIRIGLDQLYALNREVDKPLETLEERVETRMKAYHLAKAAETRRIEAEREEAAREAQRKLDEAAARLESLKTPAAKARAEETMMAAAEELDAIQQAEPEEEVQTDHSRNRPVKVPTLVSLLDVAKGVAEGLIPEDCISINMVRVRAYYKEDPETVASFPGISIVDDVQIVGRG